MQEADYDLICIGSPTWWLNPCMPIRSFMESDLAEAVRAGKRFAAIVVCHRYWKNNLATVKTLGIRRGGKVVDGIHSVAAGGPIRWTLALMSYFATGVIKDRYLGVKSPRQNLQPSYVMESQAFAGELADSMGYASESDRSSA
jgi:hypothetical protein